MADDVHVREHLPADDRLRELLAELHLEEGRVSRGREELRQVLPARPGGHAHLGRLRLRAVRGGDPGLQGAPADPRHRGARGRHGAHGGPARHAGPQRAEGARDLHALPGPERPARGHHGYLRVRHRERRPEPGGPVREHAVRGPAAHAAPAAQRGLPGRRAGAEGAPAPQLQVRLQEKDRAAAAGGPVGRPDVQPAHLPAGGGRPHLHGQLAGHVRGARCRAGRAQHRRRDARRGLPEVRGRAREH
mmetsp:Transcript_3092/g.12435  ORF Transcript_3092/g.12435 Transcript_3092/m.12435 type:complete len:247 (+) Transcript_3092:2405-3145(+)